MAAVTYDEASRRYPGAPRPAVDALNLEIADGEFLVLVGPSGCGKSTSLRMLAGLEEVTSGAIRIGDKDVTHLAPKARDIAMVFQNYALYPHMTVAGNMGFALKMAGVSKDLQVWPQRAHHVTLVSTRTRSASRCAGTAEPRVLAKGGKRWRPSRTTRPAAGIRARPGRRWTP